MNKFDQVDLEVVKRVIELNRNVDVNLLEKIKQNSLTSKDRLHLIDVVSECFAQHGLNTSDEPNGFGLQLEAIIDKLNY